MPSAPRRWKVRSAANTRIDADDSIPMRESLQINIGVIQHHVGKQRQKWAALRRSNRRCLDDVPDQDVGPQVAGDEGEQRLVPHLAPHPFEQDIVVNPVEEFLQIQVHRDAVARAPLSLVASDKTAAPGNCDVYNER